MKFELSIHAQRALAKRRIQIKWVEMAIFDPQRVENHEKDTSLRQYWRKIEELDNRVLHIVVNFRKKPIIVVTAHLDRGMRGKL